MNGTRYQTIIIIMAMSIWASIASAGQSSEDRLFAQGRYIVAISGCNDCHTPHYPETGGKVAESDWLTGSPVGFRGPWGTTYPANLRLLMQTLTEEQWLKRARMQTRPPMPWFSLHAMNESDLRAMYHFIRNLGPKGVAAPDYVDPNQAVLTPYIDFIPRNLPQQAVRK